MGLIDTAIASRIRGSCKDGGAPTTSSSGTATSSTNSDSSAVRSHTIVEAHPDVLARMRQDGWYDRPGVAVVEGRWQEVLPQLKQYDGTLAPPSWL